jgi:Domain of unknown function (DUF927)
MSLTADFLRHVLPGEGYYAAFIRETKRHFWFDSPDRLADALHKQDAFGKTVYYACSSYLDANRRIGGNAHSTRHFWLDVDAGEGKPYENAPAAALAVQQFCQAAGLPEPLYVGSGNGLYVHWPLEHSLDPDTWRRYARGLKQLCVRENLQADPARTSDIASILRAPGTHNRKNGLNKEVVCGPLVGPYPIEAFGRLLDEQTRTTVQSVGRFHVPESRRSLGDTLARTHEPSSVYGRTISESCGQLRRFKDTGGCLPEPLWYASLGVLAYCVDGNDVGHAWSSGYEGYTEKETDERLARARQLTGATTCDHFHSLDPKTCEACPHWGKIKSPISLGRQVRENETLKEKEINDLPELPDTFAWSAQRSLVAQTGGNRGKDVDVVVSSYPIYLASVQTGEVRGEWTFIFRQFIPERGWFDITISASALFGSQSSAELASKGANIHEHTHFLRYCRSAIDLHYKTGKLTMRYDQFGWKDVDTAFLYGLDLYGPTGTVRVVGNDELQIRCREDWVGPCNGGDLDVWKQAINSLFAAGCEPQSVALLAAFAAPLMRFQERDEGGAIIHLVTRESGTGKSTALIGAASVWGRREGLGLTNDDTRVSKALTLGALGNLPVIFDEIAIRDPDAIRAFVVNFTNGRDKMRATRSGEIKHTASTWQTILISAANTSLVDVLSTQNMPEAPSYRILEFGLEVPEGIRHAQGDRLRRMLRENSGHAGRVFLEWLVQPANLAWTRKMLQQVTQQTWQRTRLGPEGRFRIRTVAAIAVAGVIVRQLGLVDFSIERIMAWLFDEIGDGVVANEGWTVQTLAEFLNENIGSTLVVPRPFAAGDRQRPIQEPRQRLAIRYELSTRRYLIACSALREWLVHKEASYHEMMRVLTENGVVTRRRVQATLGAGTDIPGGQVWCCEVDGKHHLLAGVELIAQGDNVVPIRDVKL